MVDLDSIQSAVVSLKTATDIVTGLAKLKIGSEVQAKVIELNGVILSAQSSALAANSDQFALLERIRKLEAEIAKMKAWEAEKQRYALTELSSGAFAYVVKRDARAAEPLHAICAQCYEHGRKSILQWIHGQYGNVRFTCNHCKTEFDGYSNDTFSLEGLAT